jgi:hypothetical protein
MFKANDVKRLYEEKHGFEYDCVIRTRFDICPYFRVDVSRLDLREVYTTNRFDDVINVDEHIIIANSKNMDSVMDTFMFIDFFIEEFGFSLLGELPLGCQMKIIKGIHPYKLCHPEDPEIFECHDDVVRFSGVCRGEQSSIDIDAIRDDWLTRPYQMEVFKEWKEYYKFCKNVFEGKNRDGRYEWIIGDSVRNNATLK